VQGGEGIANTGNDSLAVVLVGVIYEKGSAKFGFGEFHHFQLEMDFFN
jgi:hypothetical protein